MLNVMVMMVMIVLSNEDMNIAYIDTVHPNNYNHMH